MRLVQFLVLLGVANAVGNQTAPILATDDEIAEMRKNFDIVKAAHQNSNYLSTCSKDMRSSMPACHQYGSMWCWATAIAEVTQHYTTRHAKECSGLECEIVGWEFSKQCCPYGAHKADCGSRGAYLSQIQRAANHFTGKAWKTPHGPLDQKTLDASLQAGNPIILEVGNEQAPNHIVTIHGCDGAGNYWFHDPERDYGEYLQVDYQWLLSMCMVWVKAPETKAGAKLVKCPTTGKLPNEIFRIKWKWWDVLYVPANSGDAVVV